MPLYITDELVPINKPSPYTGRIFSRDAVEAIIEKFENTDGQILGELDAPIRSTVELDRVSHAVDRLFIKDGHLCATIKVLDTPLGKIAKQLHEASVKVHLGLRGQGKVDEISKEVQDFNFCTVDITAAQDTRGDNLIDLVDFDDIMNSLEEDGFL